MIDITNAKYEFSKEEAYAIAWFDSNGFNGKIVKQLQAKTIFSLSKDGIKDRFELPQACIIADISGFMEQWEHSFKLTCKIQKLKKRTEEM